MFIAALKKAYARWFCRHQASDLAVAVVRGTAPEQKWDQRTGILALLDALCAHLGKSHWAISMRIFGKGDFFHKLQTGSDCQTRTAGRVLQWFADNWPEDLDWPKGVHRPEPTRRVA
jgi:hypothetical protein